MASLSSNLKNLMALSQINASELARKTGIAQPIIHRLSTGQNTNPKLATIKPIAQYFTVTVSQLIGEDTLPNDPSNTRAASGATRMVSRVPLISWKDAINWPANLSEYQTSSSAAYVSTDAKVSSLAYSLQVTGSSMEPLFPEGTTIIVEPNRNPQDRDFVLIHFNGKNEPELKQILIRGSNRFLKSPKPNLENQEAIPLRDADHFLGVMAQAKLDY